MTASVPLGQVKDRVTISPDTLKAWKKKRTARYKQISEVLRQAFSIKDEINIATMRNTLKHLHDLRGKAVHPPPEAAAPACYSEIGLNVEWRYVAFRFENAKIATSFALSLIAQTADKALKIMPDKVPLREYCQPLRRKLDPILEEWESQYGQLFEREE